MFRTHFKDFRRLLLTRAHPAAGLLCCGLASLAIWCVVAFMPGAGGRFLGTVIFKPRTLPEGSLTWLVALAFVPYVVGYRAAAASSSRATRAVVVAFAAAMAVALVAKVVPFVSHDIFIYAFQGRAVAVHGVNPYAVYPKQVADPYVDAMGEWLSGLKDAYGPLWTDVAALAAKAAGSDPVALLAGLKAIAAAFFLASVPLVAALVDARVRRPRAERDALVLLFAWNPALLLEFAGNGHNDSAMVFFLLLALVLAERRRDVFAALALAASFLMKYVSVLAAPFFLAHAVAAAPPRRKLAAAAWSLAPMAAAVVIAYAPYWIGGATFDGLVQQATHAGMDISSPFAFALAFAIGGPRQVLSQRTLSLAAPLAVDAFAAVSLGLVFVAFRRKIDLGRAAFGSMACYLAIACTWFMPWYLTWLAPVFVMEGAAVAAVAASAAGIYLYHAYYTAPVLGAVFAAVGLASAGLRRPAAARVRTGADV
ncbi:MAG TPA: hypothetical protein VL426_05175 [Candidatus Binatia bacterium]|jgi:hypothetical protein|nr:hypothetical protein [Candidatus Binatia bacterium]